MSIADAQLYLCTDSRHRQGDFAEFVDAAFAGGVDIIQLRDKTLEGGEQLALLQILSEAASRHGALWSVNDRADVAALTRAPVLHLGQKDLPAELARRIVEPETHIGLSTHSPDQVSAAAKAEHLDYFCVGPVWATPTKPGRAAVGTELVSYTAGLAPRRPWFAIGGIDLSNIDRLVSAGAERVVVVRAITDSDDPASSARRIRESLPQLRTATDGGRHRDGR